MIESRKTPQTNYDQSSQILVIDDDSIILKFFKIHLNKYFAKVTVANNATEAIAIVKEKEIDLVIADIFMPKTNGLQLAKKIKRLDMSIPTLLISGGELNEKIESELDSADGFLKKPFDIDDLHNFIESGLRKRRDYLELQEILEDKSSLPKVLSAKAKIEDHVPQEKVEAAKALIKRLTTKVAKPLGKT